tara:strand:+ start:1147 stop:1569 length:423 start_codon:yes stop_codon:yes gene_type:complete
VIVGLLTCFWPGQSSAVVVAYFTFKQIFQGEIMSELILKVSDETFESDVLGSELPVLVDFWAEWCGPCKMIAPVLEEIAEEFDGKLKVAKLNIDENEATAPKFGIRSIPTLILFRNGNAEATKIGAMSKSELTAFIQQAL